MEVVNLKFKDLEDKLEENLDWFSDSDMIDLKKRKNERVTVRGYKIIFPKLGVFFREGIRSLGDNEPESVYVEYDISESNVNKYKGCVYYDLDFVIRERCKEKGTSVSEIDGMDCSFELDIPFEEKEELSYEEIQKRLRNKIECVCPGLEQLFDDKKYRVAIKERNGKYSIYFMLGLGNDPFYYKFKIDLEKNKYEIDTKYDRHVKTTSLEELIYKTKQLLEDKIEFIRIPEFYFSMKIYERGLSVTGVHGPSRDMERFSYYGSWLLSTYRRECYGFVGEFRNSQFVLMGKRVEKQEVNKELKKFTRKINKLKEEFFTLKDNETLMLRVFVEETLDGYFLMEYRGLKTQNILKFPVSIEKELLVKLLNKIYRENFPEDLPDAVYK